MGLLVKAKRIFFFPPFSVIYFTCHYKWAYNLLCDIRCNENGKVKNCSGSPDEIFPASWTHETTERGGRGGFFLVFAHTENEIFFGKIVIKFSILWRLMIRWQSCYVFFLCVLSAPCTQTEWNNKTFCHVFCFSLSFLLLNLFAESFKANRSKMEQLQNKRAKAGVEEMWNEIYSSSWRLEWEKERKKISNIS